MDLVSTNSIVPRKEPNLTVNEALLAKSLQANLGKVFQTNSLAEINSRTNELKKLFNSNQSKIQAGTFKQRFDELAHTITLIKNISGTILEFEAHLEQKTKVSSEYLLIESINSLKQDLSQLELEFKEKVRCFKQFIRAKSPDLKIVPSSRNRLERMHLEDLGNKPGESDSGSVIAVIEAHDAQRSFKYSISKANQYFGSDAFIVKPNREPQVEEDLALYMKTFTSVREGQKFIIEKPPKTTISSIRLSDPSVPFVLRGNKIEFLANYNAALSLEVELAKTHLDEYRFRKSSEEIAAIDPSTKRLRTQIKTKSDTQKALVDYCSGHDYIASSQLGKMLDPLLDVVRAEDLVPLLGFGNCDSLSRDIAYRLQDLMPIGFFDGHFLKNNKIMSGTSHAFVKYRDQKNRERLFEATRYVKASCINLKLENGDKQEINREISTLVDAYKRNQNLDAARESIKDLGNFIRRLIRSSKYSDYFKPKGVRNEEYREYGSKEKINIKLIPTDTEVSDNLKTEQISYNIVIPEQFKDMCDQKPRYKDFVANLIDKVSTARVHEILEKFTNRKLSKHEVKEFLESNDSVSNFRMSRESEEVMERLGIKADHFYHFYHFTQGFVESVEKNMAGIFNNFARFKSGNLFTEFFNSFVNNGSKHALSNFVDELREDLGLLDFENVDLEYNNHENGKKGVAQVDFQSEFAKEKNLDLDSIQVESTDTEGMRKFYREAPEPLKNLLRCLSHSIQFSLLREIEQKLKDYLNRRIDEFISLELKNTDELDLLSQLSDFNSAANAGNTGQKLFSYRAHDPNDFSNIFDACTMASLAKVRAKNFDILKTIQTDRPQSKSVVPLKMKREQLGHKIKHKSNSGDFHSFITYQPGDDARRINWKVSARSDKLLVNSFEDEEINKKPKLGFAFTLESIRQDPKFLQQLTDIISASIHGKLNLGSIDFYASNKLVFSLQPPKGHAHNSDLGLCKAKVSKLLSEEKLVPESNCKWLDPVIHLKRESIVDRAEYLGCIFYLVC